MFVSDDDDEEEIYWYLNGHVVGLCGSAGEDDFSGIGSNEIGNLLLGGTNSSQSTTTLIHTRCGGKAYYCGIG